MWRQTDYTRQQTEVKIEAKLSFRRPCKYTWMATQAPLTPNVALVRSQCSASSPGSGIPRQITQMAPDRGGKIWRKRSFLTQLEMACQPLWPRHVISTSTTTTTTTTTTTIFVTLTKITLTPLALNQHVFRTVKRRSLGPIGSRRRGKATPVRPKQEGPAYRLSRQVAHEGG